MSVSLDLTATPGSAYRLAMYFVDRDSTTRRSCVEVFDHDTRKRVVPVQVVEDHHRGQYLVHDCYSTACGAFAISQSRSSGRTVELCMPLMWSSPARSSTSQPWPVSSSRCRVSGWAIVTTVSPQPGP
jgi:hypothetical protein